MNDPGKHQPSHDDERPVTAGEELLHAVEKAETDVVDDGESEGEDREAADALTPSEDAQEDVSRHRT